MDIATKRKKKKEYMRIWRKNNPGYYINPSKEYYLKNKDKIREYKKRWDLENKEYYSEYRKKYYLSKSEYIKNKVKIYRSNNRAKIRNYIVEREKVDVKFKLANSMRKRIVCALRQKQKSGSVVRDLGCSIEEFIKYIESKFEDGMSWSNRGKFGWHLDHIKPLCSFDLSNREEFLSACNYKNIQPLWWYDNLKKGGKSN